MPAPSVVNPAPLLLGIECGGTRTVALASRDRRNPEARITAGPCNLRLVTDDALLQHFRPLAAQLPSPAAIGIGMAGARNRADCLRVESVLETVWPGVPHCVAHDLESALAAAESGSEPDARARVMVLSGTGSCCYGRTPAGQTAKVGGWGHLLGDRGSAYDIVHRALRATARHRDHTGIWGGFGVQALQRLALNEPDDLIAWLQQAGKTEIAALAPEVFSAAAAGDRVARQIVTETASLLAEDAIACARRLKVRGSDVHFVLAGSVLLHQTRLASAISRRLRAALPGCLVESLARDSAWGAVALARRALSAAVDSRPASVRSTPRKPVPVPAPIPTSTQLSPTERRNPRSARLDRLPLTEAIDLMLSEESTVPGVIRGHSRQIARLIRKVATQLDRGGRLFYAGAGTSGRLGVLDASECPPTFRTSPSLVQGIIAGGVTALHAAVEGAEDDFAAGGRSIDSRGVGPLDVVLGIAASGRTPFVWGALHSARARGGSTALLCFNPHLRFHRGARPDLVLALDVGPEILTGSTRLKCGTATKLVLNLLSTLTMVRLGKVVGNLMIDLNPSNVKLRDRACRIVMELTQRSRSEAEEALVQTGWVVAKAVRELGRKG